eukprot:1951855-Prymnesium_polylepis.1
MMRKQSLLVLAVLAGGRVRQATGVESPLAPPEVQPQLSPAMPPALRPLPAAPPPPLLPAPSGTVYQFAFSSVRGGGRAAGNGTTLSVAEIRLFDASGVRVPIAWAASPDGLPGNSREAPASAVDDDLLTKWLDMSSSPDK